jgi:hypothetical protein
LHHASFDCERIRAEKLITDIILLQVLYGGKISEDGIIRKRKLLKGISSTTKGHQEGLLAG